MQILADRSVYLDATLSMEVRTKIRGSFNYYIGRERFYMQGYGIACNVGSPFKVKLDQM